jgi:L-threonylcarbamoyladenylate synthase
MRALDNIGVDVILVRAPEETGLGLALYDRLMRAAEGRIIEVE